MSTVSKVRTLFAKLNKNGGSAEQDMYSAWLRFVNESERQIEAFYQDDGEPAITVFRGENNVPVCMYRWVPPNTVSPGFKKAEGVRLPSTVAPSKASYHMSVSTSTSFVRSSSTEYEQSEDWHNIDWTRIKGAVFFSHGITESCRFSLLNLREMETCAALQHTKELNESERQTLVKLACSDEGCVQQFRNGWADAIVSAGYVLYAIDMQGHGLSQAWRNSRCNVENFCHYILDTLTAIEMLHVRREWPDYTPLFLSGLSMGGCLATRLCQIGFKEKRLTTYPSENALPQIAGLILFCPALSTERLKRLWKNRILSMFGRILSSFCPTLEVAHLAAPKQYPWLLDVIIRDPLVHTRRLPARLAWEVLCTMDAIFPAVHELPPELRVCLIQSKYDTMTDPEGSEAFMKMLSCPENRIHFLDHGWHFLSKEPGHGENIQLAIDFMNDLKRK